MAFGRNNPDNKRNLEEEMRGMSHEEEKDHNEMVEEQEEVDDKHIQPEERVVDENDHSNTQQPEQPNSVDGWKTISHDEMPNHGCFYPASWQFAYRCPKAKEVVNFSTVNNEDIAAIYAVTEDLIKKCVRIFNTDTEREVPSSEINDNDRFFFMLKLREFYVPSDESRIMIPTICPTCSKDFSQPLYADSLIFKQPTDALIEAFDGRIFTLEMGEYEVKFRIPTISTTGRLFRYIVQRVRDQQQNRRQNEGRNDAKLATDQLFLKIAPFLFVDGHETIPDIINKYKILKKNDELVEIYTTIIDSIDLNNFQYIESTCPYCGGEDVVDITFPGYRTFFRKSLDKKGYFGNNE